MNDVLYWVIESADGKQYWSVIHGWLDNKDRASFFTSEEKMKQALPAKDAMWKHA